MTKLEKLPRGPRKSGKVTADMKRTKNNAQEPKSREQKKVTDAR